MKYDLPRPSMAALVTQCSLVLACAVCLYLFLNAMQTKKSYAAAIMVLSQKQQSLTQAAQQLDTYRQFVATDPFYQCNTEEPQWKKWTRHGSTSPMISSCSDFRTFIESTGHSFLIFFPPVYKMSKSTMQQRQRQ